MAAKRLHRAMRDYGLDSKLLCLRVAEKNDPTIIKFSDSLLRKLLRASRLPFNNYMQNEKILRKHPGNYEYFSFPNTDYKLHQHQLVKEADIINLHFISGFIDYNSFFTNVRKPLFWTLHDMNPFQGGFHYLGDKLKNAAMLGKLDETIENQKKEAYDRTKKLHIVALNTWMKNLSNSSSLFNKRSHTIIPNTIDIDLFVPKNKMVSRNKFNLPRDKRIFLFVSADISNDRKGGDLLYKVINEIELENVLFCQVGKSVEVNSNNKAVSIEYIDNEMDLPYLYSAVDAVILPSREDNLPNVMLEALACGVPVIASPVGGCLDFIVSGKNGALIAEISVEGIKKAIFQFNKYMDQLSPREIREKVIRKIAPEIVINKYLEIYESALKRS